MTSADLNIHDVEKLSIKRTLPQLIAFGVVLCILLLPGINHGLWRPDEPRVAGICAEMARTGDICVPQLNGRPFLEKPPLYFVCGALSGRLFGMGQDVSYRLVSLMFAAFTIILTVFIASRKLGLLHGLIAAGILVSSWEFFQLSRWVLVDMALVFGVTLAMYAYQRVLDDQRVVDSILLGLSLGIAFMAKGLVGPAIFVSALAADMIRTKDITVLFRIRPVLVTLLALVKVLPWVAGLYAQGGWSYVREVIMVNNIMRFLGTPEGAALGHQQSLLYYFYHFPGNFLPWTFLFIPALVASLRNMRQDCYVSWFVGPFILLSLASTKRGFYLVPLYPAAACMIAGWLASGSRKRWEETMLKITWLLSIIFSFAPLAGLFFGRPALGIVMGITGLLSLAVIIRCKAMKQIRGFPLVMAMCVALITSSMVYFSYMKPHEDYLDFARQALKIVDNQELNVLGHDQANRGLVSLVFQRHFAEKYPPEIQTSGFYFWADKRDRQLEALQKNARVNIVLERELGGRNAMVAYVIPKRVSPEGSG